MSNQKLSADIDFEYIKALNENDLKFADLPSEIQEQITDIKKRHSVLKPAAGRYNNNPTEKLKESFDNSYNTIIKLDLEIAETILDYLEADLPDDPALADPPAPIEPVVPATPEPDPTPIEPITVPDPINNPEPVAAEPDPTPVTPIEIPDEQETTIRAKINSDSRISVKDLTEILGYKPNGMPITVGKLSLRSVLFNSAYYRVV